MEDLKLFTNDVFGEILVILKDNKEYFDANSVASLLGYSNPRDAIIRHCKEEGVILHEVGVTSKTRNGENLKTQMYKKKFIDEGNLYRLIMKSKLKTACKFERWVCDEVIPSIRNHGAYIEENIVDELLENPDLIISLAQKLKNERLKVKALNKAIIANEEYINLGRLIENTNDAITIGQYAKLISNKTNMGRNRLYKWFRDNGYFITKGDDKNTPKQVYIENGYFKVCEKVMQSKNGEILCVKPLITGKGQRYFIDKIIKSNYLNWSNLFKYARW